MTTTPLAERLLVESNLVESNLVESNLVKPHLKGALARVASSLTTAVVVPGALLWGTLQLFNVAVAVIVALAWLALVMGWRYVSGRPVSPLLLLTLGILALKTALTLATGNTYVYFVQPVFTDFAAATVFLGSLWTARPIVSRLAPDFFPMTATVAARPEIRALFRGLTLMWGVVILIKAGVTLWLLETLSTANFVLVKGSAIIALTVTAALATVAWSLVVGRRQGLLSA